MPLQPSIFGGVLARAEKLAAILAARPRCRCGFPLALSDPDEDMPRPWFWCPECERAWTLEEFIVDAEGRVFQLIKPRGA